MKTKALYACGSNLLSHIAPRNGDGGRGGTEEPEYGDGLIATPRCVLSGLSGARVLYVGWGDVLCMFAMPPWSPPPPANFLPPQFSPKGTKVEITPSTCTPPPSQAPPSPILILRGSSCARLCPRKLSSQEAEEGITLPPCPDAVGRTRTKVSRGFGDSNGQFVGVVLEDCAGVWVLRMESTGGSKGVTGLEWCMVPDVGGGPEPEEGEEKEEEEEEEKGVAREKGWRSKNGRIIDISVAGNEEVATLVAWPSDDGVEGSTVAEYYTLELYATLGDLLSPIANPPRQSPPPKPTRVYPLPPTHLPTPHSLVSTLTSHALLLHLLSPGVNEKQTPNHQNTTTTYPLILTTGDPRHPSLLLHSSPPEKAARRPLVPPQALEGIPGISRLVADPGGWYIAAIAAPEHGGAVYLWGGQAGKSSKLGLKGAILRNGEGENVKEDLEAEKEEEGEEEVVIVIPPQESPEPRPPVQPDATAAGGDGDGNRDNDEDATVVDFALGAGHLLILLDSGEVLGLGRCDEGQLGSLAADDGCQSVGSQQDQQDQQWVKMTLCQESAARMVVRRIWAGGWESWMLVDVEEG